MVVRRRLEVCASADHGAVNHEETKITKTETQKLLRALRTFVVLAFTSSFYFGHCRAGDDDGESEEEKCGRDLARYSFGVKSWHHLPDPLKYRNVSGAHENREENTGQRAAGDESRTEQCSRAQFGFFGLA